MMTQVKYLRAHVYNIGMELVKLFACLFSVLNFLNIEFVTLK